MNLRTESVSAVNAERKCRKLSSDACTAEDRTVRTNAGMLTGWKMTTTCTARLFRK